MLRRRDARHPGGRRLARIRAAGVEHLAQEAGGQLVVVGVLAVGRAERERVRLGADGRDRKSTRLNSSHQIISYAVFCLKKKKKTSLFQRLSKKQQKKTIK